MEPRLEGGLEPRLDPRLSGRSPTLSSSTPPGLLPWRAVPAGPLAGPAGVGDLASRCRAAPVRTTPTHAHPIARLLWSGYPMCVGQAQVDQDCKAITIT